MVRACDNENRVYSANGGDLEAKSVGNALSGVLPRGYRVAGARVPKKSLETGREQGGTRWDTRHVTVLGPMSCGVRFKCPTQPDGR